MPDGEPHAEIVASTICGLAPSTSMATAGGCSGPALIAILEPAPPTSLVLDRDAIDGDLRRRQEGCGRGARRRIERVRVEVLAGPVPATVGTLGTPLALVVSNRDHENSELGNEAVAPRGRPRRARGRSR